MTAENEFSRPSTKIGHQLGTYWRKYLLAEKKLLGGCAEKGRTAVAFTLMKWTTRSVLVLLLLCAGLLMLSVYGISLLANRSVVKANTEPQDWVIRGRDHRNSGFYDPINYSDPDDPRFHDH